jgi:hypothetical protein
MPATVAKDAAVQKFTEAIKQVDGDEITEWLRRYSRLCPRCSEPLSFYTKPLQL